MKETDGILKNNTPLEDYRADYGLMVKREDLCCPDPGPPFSKMRGVLSHVQSKYNEGVRLFGVLDTVHSQAGHAVALACRALGARCVNFFPVYVRDIRRDLVPDNTEVGDICILGDGAWTILRDPQLQSRGLGAELAALKAGRSSVLFHQARKAIERAGGYMMPNALKLPETVEETAAEVVRTIEHAPRGVWHFLRNQPWLVAASSGTIAAGVLRGLAEMFRGAQPELIIHLGYHRSHETALNYIVDKSGVKTLAGVRIIDEGYAYADKARPGEVPPWPCNEFYDLKAFRWWVDKGRYESDNGAAVMWNIG